MSEALPQPEVSPQKQKRSWRGRGGVNPLYRRDYSRGPSVRTAEVSMVHFVTAIQRYLETGGALPDPENPAAKTAESGGTADGAPPSENIPQD